MKPLVTLIARTLAVLWAGFWLFFFVVESLVWRTALQAMMVWVALGLFFVVLTAAAWRWEAAGGTLLLVAGLAAGVTYWTLRPPDLPWWSVVLTTLVLGLPPLVAGILFLVHRELSKPAMPRA